MARKTMMRFLDSSTPRPTEEAGKISKWLLKMGWKLRKGRRFSAMSRSTGDLLKAVRINSGQRLSGNRESLSESPGTSGYLYVLADGGFWFRMWVVLKADQLETFYEKSDKLPLEVVHLAEAMLVIPRTIEVENPEDHLYPIRIVRKEQPVTCLAAENCKDQERWASAIQNCLETRSLDIEGLNLEYSNRSSRKDSDGQVDRSSLFNKLDLVEELLAQRDKCGELPKDKKTLDLCQKMVDADNWYDRVLMSEQQEALRRATYLKQRKISTQLKADTIRKQLSKSSKSGKRRPKSLCVSYEEEVEFYEEQLEELNNKLKNIHTSLGQTEKEAEVAYRKLGRKRESEMKRLHSDADLGTSLKRASDPYLPTIWVSRSQEDFRSERKQSKGSFIRRNSPKAVKKYFSEGLKLSSSTTSITEVSGKKSSVVSGRSVSQGCPSASKNRISPLRLLGNFVDTQLLRAKNKVKKMEVNSGAGTLNRKSESDSAEETENCPQRCQSSLNDLHYKGLAESGSTGVAPHRPQLCKSLSTSSEKLRTEIDPNALAEIEAFECLTEQFMHDGRPVK